MPNEGDKQWPSLACISKEPCICVNNDLNPKPNAKPAWPLSSQPPPTPPANGAMSPCKSAWQRSPDPPHPCLLAYVPQATIPQPAPHLPHFSPITPHPACTTAALPLHSPTLPSTPLPAPLWPPAMPTPLSHPSSPTSPATPAQAVLITSDLTGAAP